MGDTLTTSNPLNYIKLAKSPFHLATTITTLLSLSYVHKKLPYQSVTDSMSAMKFQRYFGSRM